MGLDISVFKPVKVAQADAQSIYKDAKYYNYSLQDNPELSKFKDFAVTIEDEEYDLDYIFSTYNFKEEDLISSFCHLENEDGPDSCVVYDWELRDGRTFSVDEKLLLRKKVTYDMIFFEEVGYQRKGANAVFYSDGMWDSPFVTEYSEVLYHWKKYFSGDTKKEKDELKPAFLTGLGTELALDADENRNRFKENILDKFVEGKTVVGYH